MKTTRIMGVAMMIVGSGLGSELATYVVEKGKPLITLVE